METLHLPRVFGHSIILRRYVSLLIDVVHFFSQSFGALAFTPPLQRSQPVLPLLQLASLAFLPLQFALASFCLNLLLVQLLLGYPRLQLEDFVVFDLVDFLCVNLRLLDFLGKLHLLLLEKVDAVQQIVLILLGFLESDLNLCQRLTGGIFLISGLIAAGRRGS